MFRTLLLSTILLLSTGCCSCCGSSEETSTGETATDSSAGTETGGVRMWGGVNSGIHEARRSVVKTPEEWTALWTKHVGERLPLQPVPEIDWTKDMVLIVVLGDRPTGGYGVEISGVEQLKDRLVVRSHTIEPAPGSVQTQAVTSPFAFRTVPRFDGEVEFREE